MDEPFMISVLYKGKKLDFEARLQKWGYSHRFLISVDGIPMFFERDEEGSYRALLAPEAAHLNKSLIDAELLKAITAAIEFILS